MRRLFKEGSGVKGRESHSLFAHKTGRQFVRGRNIEQRSTAYEYAAEWRKGYRWILVLLWIFFVGVVVYQGIVSDALSIERIEVEGANLVTADAVESAVRKMCEEKYFMGINHTNMLLISTGALERMLLTTFPLIRDVTVKKVFPHTVRVSLLERGDLLFWCSGDTPCFLLDELGRATARPEALEEHRVSQMFLVDESGKSVTSGDTVTSPELLYFVRQFSQALLEQSGMHLQDHVFLPSTYADELRFETSEGVSLQVSADIPIETTLNTLRIVREKAISKEQLPALVSVDLRVQGKAFYRLRDDSTSAEVSQEK